MKKFLSLLLAFCLLAMVSACGGREQPATEAATDAAATEARETQPGVTEAPWLPPGAGAGT